MMDSRKYFPLLFAMIAVAVMCTPAFTVGTGYASESYDAVTENTGNTVASGYYVVGMFLKNDDTYTSASSNVINSRMGCARNGGGDYILDGEKQLTPNNLYIRISTVNTTALSFHPSVTASVKDGAITIATPSVTFHDPDVTEGDDTVTDLSPNKYYRVTSVASFSNVTVSSDTVTGSITITCNLVAPSMSGIYTENDVTVTLDVVSQIVEEVINENPDLDDNTVSTGNGSYSATIDSEDVDLPAVSVTNNDNENEGVANPNGNTALDIYVPMNRPFVIALFDNSSSGTSGNFTITVNGYTYTGSTTIDSTPKYFFISNYSNHSLNYISGQAGFQTYIVNPDKWIVSTTSNVRIQLAGSQGLISNTVMMDIVFKP